MGEVKGKSSRIGGLTTLLAASSPNKVFFSIVLGVLAGLSYSLLIPLVLLSLQYMQENARLSSLAQDVAYVGGFEISAPRFALVFVSLCLFILVARTASATLLNRAALHAGLLLRESLYHGITRTSIADLERIGPSRIITMLSSDVPRIVAGATAFPSMLMNCATAFGLLIVIAWLNTHVFLFALGTLVVGVVTYRVPILLGRRLLIKARRAVDDVQEGIRGLLNGAKELKVNRERRTWFVESELLGAERTFRRHQRRGMSIIIASMSYGDLICFFAIGVVTFLIASVYSLSQNVLVGTVMTLLYIAGPVGAILNMIVPVTEAGIATRRVLGLLDQMKAEPADDVIQDVTCTRVQLSDVRFRYPADPSGETPFELGPISLSLERGQITMLVGGNGSGKTTLAKILSLHYLPSAGSVRFDDLQVNDATRESCRQHVCAIYSDFHVFARLFGATGEALHQLVDQFATELELRDKVSLRDGRIAHKGLSDGQRKRLALLGAYIENRSIYVLDEWAADQDPKFKDIFYRRLLPRLRQAGKIVVVITHDDRYFDVADQVLHFENGQLIQRESGRERRYAHA